MGGGVCCRDLGVGCEVYGLRGAVWGVGCGVQGSGCSVWGVGCGVWGVECRVLGVGCGVWVLGEQGVAGQFPVHVNAPFAT